MEKGEFVRGEITITPADNGSYLIRKNWHVNKGELYYPVHPAHMVCFSNHADLLKFLGEEYPAANPRPPEAWGIIS